MNQYSQKTRLVLWFVSVLFLCNLAYGAAGNLDIVIVKESGKNSVVLMGKDQMAAKSIYSATSLSDLSRSYDKNYFSFIQHGDLLNPDSNQWQGDTGQKLIIMDLNHNPVDEIADARRYEWSPFEHKLVTICGERTEEGSEYTCKEIFVYDLKKRSKIIIPLVAYDLFWARHDNTIYLDTYNNKQRVYSFNPVDKTLNKTSYRGIYFSWDGLYYYNDPYEGGGEFSVWRTRDNMRIETPSILKDSSHLCGVGWIKSTHCLLVSELIDERSCYLVNVDSGKMALVDQSIGQRIRGCAEYLKREILGDKAEEIMQSVK